MLGENTLAVGVELFGKVADAGLLGRGTSAAVRP